MVEVFKTNVRSQEQADMLLLQLRNTFTTYAVNFDLEDCDRILRVQSLDREIALEVLIGFLGVLGCRAEVLNDDIPPNRFRCPFYNYINASVS